jgi:hypothetical protein
MTARQSLFQARRCSALPNHFDFDYIRRIMRHGAFERAPATAAPARGP